MNRVRQCNERQLRCQRIRRGVKAQLTEPPKNLGRFSPVIAAALNPSETRRNHFHLPDGTHVIVMRQAFRKNAVVSISILFVTAVVQLLAKASFTESKCTSPQVEY